MRNAVLLLSTLLLLMAVNATIYQREQLLSNGQIAYLELAPVDPRSLMQGDYMRLNFKVADTAFRGQRLESLDDGRIVLARDARRVATFRRYDDGGELAANELRMAYRVRNGQVKFATNAFFFQEGDARLYEAARYGEFRVAPNGDAILTRLRDKDLTLLGPDRS
ncbi:MAG: GDYXXLXY domain-containing protein [Desulfuromonadales bacterium]|nr:GDYXXLXY domain-containing protein [Desulfuromonadales bacterium]